MVRVLLAPVCPRAGPGAPRPVCLQGALCCEPRCRRAPDTNLPSHFGDEDTRPRQLAAAHSQSLDSSLPPGAECPHLKPPYDTGTTETSTSLGPAAKKTPPLL